MVYIFYFSLSFLIFFMVLVKNLYYLFYYLVLRVEVPVTMQ